MVKHKLIITKEQLSLLTKVIKEDAVNNKVIITQIVDYLNSYYEPNFGTHQEKGEYFNSPMITNKISDELITPKNLLNHLKLKFTVSPEFLGQVIKDWYDGKLDGKYMLTKNISSNK